MIVLNEKNAAKDTRKGRFSRLSGYISTSLRNSDKLPVNMINNEARRMLRTCGVKIFFIEAE